MRRSLWEDEEEGVDALRTRVADLDAALRMHVELAAELSAELSARASSASEPCMRCEAAEAAAQAAALTSRSARDAVQSAAARALRNQLRRALCRRVLAAWHSHCEKVCMLRHMREMAERRPKGVGSAAAPTPRLSFPEPPPFPSPPEDRRRHSAERSAPRLASPPLASPPLPPPHTPPHPPPHPPLAAEGARAMESLLACARRQLSVTRWKLALSLVSRRAPHAIARQIARQIAREMRGVASPHVAWEGEAVRKAEAGAGSVEEVRVEEAERKEAERKEAERKEAEAAFAALAEEVGHAAMLAQQAATEAEAAMAPAAAGVAADDDSERACSGDESDEPLPPQASSPAAVPTPPAARPASVDHTPPAAASRAVATAPGNPWDAYALPSGQTAGSAEGSAREAGKGDSSGATLASMRDGLAGKLLSKLGLGEAEESNGMAPWEERDRLRVKLQHLTTENHYLRERLMHVEGAMQPLLEECQTKRELLYHVYVLHACSQHGMGKAYEDFTAASAEQKADWLSAWALPGLNRFRAMEDKQRETLVADAMESVLEDTLRLNKTLNLQVLQLKKELRRLPEGQRQGAKALA